MQTCLRNTNHSYQIVGLTILAFAISFCPVFAEQPAALPAGLILKSASIPEDVTGPIRSFNETTSLNVTPSDNAAVFLLQAFGDQALDPALRRSSLTMMGIEALSPTAPRFLFLEEYTKLQRSKRGEENRGSALELQASLFQACERVWTTEQFSDVAKYLEANRAALDAIVAAANKPRFFVPQLTADNPSSLLSASKTIERRMPFIARTLSARALNRIASHQFADALTDLIACHKLANLLAAGSPLDNSVAQAHLINSFTFKADFALIEHGKLTSEQASAYRRALEQVPPQRPAARAADIGERAVLHQEIELIRHNETDIRNFFEVPQSDRDEKKPVKGVPEIKWDLTLKRANELQDRIVKALSTQERSAQNKLFDQLDRDYQAWSDSVDSTTRKFAMSEKLDVDAASAWIGECMAMSLRPFYRQRRMADDRSIFRRDMVMIGLALISYRHDHGEYPAALANLAPDYLKTVTSEADSLDKVIYVRESPSHIRLISKGANLEDDAGKLYNDDDKLELH